MFKIIPFYFVLSIFIGYLILYILSPNPQIIIKNPDINKDISDLYIDDSNVCYKYKKQKVDCNKI